MDVKETGLDGLKVLTPRVFGDARGYFMESFNTRTFMESVGEDPGFVQDNESKSSRGVLRGLHYQIQNPQGKLVRAVHGEIFDVAVDVRRSSPTFGQWYGTTLSSENKRQLWVPIGFAHGFLTLSETAVVAYKASDYYCAEGERSIIWNDPDIAIEWPDINANPELSEKDQAAVRFNAVETFA